MFDVLPAGVQHRGSPAAVDGPSPWCAEWRQALALLVEGEGVGVTRAEPLAGRRGSGGPRSSTVRFERTLL